MNSGGGMPWLADDGMGLMDGWIYIHIYDIYWICICIYIYMMDNG